jgi:uncharacterized membrane protein YesL
MAVQAGSLRIFLGGVITGLLPARLPLFSMYERLNLGKHGKVTNIDSFRAFRAVRG